MACAPERSANRKLVEKLMADVDLSRMMDTPTRTLTQETVPVPRLMMQETAASILGVSPKWLERDRWVEKRIPFVKIGRGVRYRACDIAAYIDANLQAAE